MRAAPFPVEAEPLALQKFYEVTATTTECKQISTSQGSREILQHTAWALP